jgi:hypothetical protein
MTQPNFNTENFRKDTENLIDKLNESNISKNLSIVLKTQEKLKEIKSSMIKFSSPVLKQGENSVIFPHTINVIQGQAGVHKSRLAEIICSALLKLHNCDNELLCFKRFSFDAEHTIVYVDTERNLTEQLPFALQSIQIKAGYEIDEHPINFEYISILQINRAERFNVLNEFLERIKQKTNSPLFIVLDVSTDCIQDFNRTEESMKLIDLMNMAINEHNVIFLCLIHENPNSNKARGHFGTELMNKASTVMQVSFEKDVQQNDTDIIRVKYLKCRSTARYLPFYIKYSNDAKGLILAEATEIAGIVRNRKLKVSHETLIEFIEMQLADGTALSRNELLTKLIKEFDLSERSIEDRITEIINSDLEILNENGETCKLTKTKKEKTIYYSLLPKLL